MLSVSNHGPLIVETNFWDLPIERAGNFYLSTNAGAFRLLVPRSQEAAVPEMATAREVVVSRGPWPQVRRAEGIEILFDDGSDSPFALHLSIEAVDRLPLDSDAGQEWLFTAWTSPRRGKPHQALQRPAWYRRVPQIPYLKARLP